MKLRALLEEQIEREREYLSHCLPGSDEYDASTKRLNILEDKLADLEKHESDKKSKLVGNILEGVKVAGGIALPIIGFVVVTAFEKDDSFSSSLKGVINCFIPKNRL